MNKKNFLIVGIVLFVLLTLIAMSMDVSQRKKVSFTNQNLALNNENPNIENKTTNVNSTNSKFSNKNISTDNTGVNLQGTGMKLSGSKVKSERTDIDFEPFDNQNTNYSSQNTSSDNQSNYYKSFDDFKNRKQRLENARNQINNASPRSNNQRTSRYVVKNIDWSTWKSEFINKILDESMSITSLDDYGVGTWFYYSFIVTSDGAIKNVIVTSPYLSDEDKQRIKNLIKSNEYQDITIFPANSRRVTSKVDAVVMLGNSEKKSNPSDFNDIERIKMSLP